MRRASSRFSDFLCAKTPSLSFNFPLGCCRREPWHRSDFLKHIHTQMDWSQPEVPFFSIRSRSLAAASGYARIVWMRFLPHCGLIGVERRRCETFHSQKPHSPLLCISQLLFCGWQTNWFPKILFSVLDPILKSKKNCLWSNSSAQHGGFSDFAYCSLHHLLMGDLNHVPCVQLMSQNISTLQPVPLEWSQFPFLGCFHSCPLRWSDRKCFCILKKAPR